jgi:hypothetical protein
MRTHKAACVAHNATHQHQPEGTDAIVRALFYMKNTNERNIIGRKVT